MAHEVLVDLIRQVKTVTRAEAGLSDYDPTHNLPPPLPSLAEAVAAFDPSPPYLRCKNCKGRLLRGVQSVLCIYCGRPNDALPDPISFKDTFAYRWLLESLHLDGSEMVGLTTEKGELNRGQSAPKIEIPLSDFLNMKVTWPTEMDKKGSVSNKKSQERSSLHLTGVDLDNFFPGSQTLNAFDTPEDHSFTSNHVEAAEIKEAVTQNNLSFFENVQPSESTLHSSESIDVANTAEAKEVATRNDFSFFQNVQPAKLAAHTSKDKDDDDDFSGWEATFQSADSGGQLDSSKTFDAFVAATVSSGDQHESSKLSEPFGGSTVDLSSQLDSVFGPGKDLKDGKAQDDKAASLSVGDWNDDLWNSLSTNVSQQTGQSDSNVATNDAMPQDKQGFDWLGVDQWQSNNVNAPSSSTTYNDEDSFFDWNDFTSSTSINVSSENSGIKSHNQPIADSGKTSDLNLFSSDDKFEEMDFGSFSQADPFPSSSSRENVPATMIDIGLEVSSSDRTVDTEREPGRRPGQHARDGDGGGDGDGDGDADADADVEAASIQQGEEVETILSQVHDLSFMLENNLSLPPKSNNVHS